MKKQVAFAVVLLAIACTAYADFFAHCYWVTSGTRRAIAWTAEPGATGYEVQARRMESGKTFTWRTSETQLVVNWKTPGHYVVYVRWYKLIDGVTTFGEWKNSLETDSSLVFVGDTWAPRAWIIIIPTNY